MFENSWIRIFWGRNSFVSRQSSDPKVIHQSVGACCSYSSSCLIVLFLTSKLPLSRKVCGGTRTKTDSKACCQDPGTWRRSWGVYYDFLSLVHSLHHLWNKKRTCSWVHMTLSICFPQKYAKEMVSYSTCMYLQVYIECRYHETFYSRWIEPLDCCSSEKDFSSNSIREKSTIFCRANIQILFEPCWCSERMI